jgi:hydroxyacylglutathione hydrolase
MSLQMDTFITGPLEVNTTVLQNGGQVAVIDPGSMTPDRFTQFLDAGDLTVDQIWLTHGHGDHISGVSLLKQQYPDARIYCPSADQTMLADPTMNLSSWYMVEITSPPADVLLTPGDELTLGDTRWMVLDTAGHTPGGVSFYCAAESVVFTGDALFASSIGKTEIPGGDMAQLIGNIRDNLLSLPDDTRAFPGHGRATTIARERTSNPFLRADGSALE